MHITMPLTAGQFVEFYEPGDFFRLMAATASLTVIYYRNGKEITEAENVTVGYAEQFKDQAFDRIAIQNGATAQTITIAARLGSVVQYDTPPNGQVTVTNNASTSFTHAQKTVTTTSAAMLTSNSNRRYLLIQNRDTTGNIWVMLNGATATQTAGIKIEPGGSLELTPFCSTNFITAIGDIASNANIMVVEGNNQ